MGSRTSIILSMAAVILLVATGSRAEPATAPVTQGAPQSARGVVEQITRDALVVLRDEHLSKVEKSHKVRDLAYTVMDFQTLARLALGRYWRGLDPQKRDAYVEEFKQHVTATYGHTTDQYNDEDIRVTGDREEPDGDYTVQTRIVGTNDKGVRTEVAKVDYRLRHEADGQWKVIDVTIDNISLVVNFRAQFQEIMANGGIDSLIKQLHEKNAGQQ